MLPMKSSCNLKKPIKFVKSKLFMVRVGWIPCWVSKYRGFDMMANPEQPTSDTRPSQRLIKSRSQNLLGMTYILRL